jgi:signal transduction histidine kinase
MGDRLVPREQRSLLFYLTLSALYATLVYWLIQWFYSWELAGAGLLPRTFGPSEVFLSTFSVHAWSFLAWLALSVVAGIAAHRFQQTLVTALAAARQRAAELAEVEGDLAAALEAEKRRASDLSLLSDAGEALSGPLGVHDIATQFLQRVRRVLGEGPTAAVVVSDEGGLTFRVIGADGPLAPGLAGAVIAVAALPSEWRAQVMERRELLAVPDTAAAGESWRSFAARAPGLASVAWLYVYPLVSGDRLVGGLLVLGGVPGGLDSERVQVAGILARYVAGALHNAVSVAEAQARAERANLINRVAQRARVSMNPDEVLRSAVEELGRALGASRAFVRLDSPEADLRASYEWTATGVAGMPRGAAISSPVGSLVRREGHTVVVDDVAQDPRLNDPTLGGREDLLRAGTTSMLATPIVLAGRLVGVLALDQVDTARVWSGDDVRLVEAVARELRVAIATARLFLARQRESERLLALHQASNVLAAQTDPDTVLEEILRHAVGLLGGGSGSFYRWDPEAGVLRCVHNWQVPAGDPTPDVRMGEGVAGRTFAQMKPLIINDYPSWDNATLSGISAGLCGVLSVPLIRSGTPLGVLLIRSYDPTTKFTDDDLRLLTLFGDQAAAAFVTAEAFERQRRAVEELERLNKAKSDFVTVVSHEFRTPLTGIRGFSEMMCDEDFSVAEMKEFAADINREAQRLTRLINEMLDLARMESGRMRLNLEQVDLNAIVEEVAERTRPTAPEHPIRLELDRLLPPLTGDRDKLVQVVTNLVSNAVKYSPLGGQILIRSRVDGDVAHVAVQDQGMGIPADALEMVFERYARIESGAGRLIQGTGLGLPIVRQIVELHGGRTWVESTLGQGSVFQFTLPLGAAPEPNRVES